MTEEIVTAKESTVKLKKEYEFMQDRNPSDEGISSKK
jgi:hypothetical protein